MPAEGQGTRGLILAAHALIVLAYPLVLHRLGSDQGLRNIHWIAGYEVVAELASDRAARISAR